MKNLIKRLEEARRTSVPEDEYGTLAALRVVDAKLKRHKVQGSKAYPFEPSAETGWISNEGKGYAQWDFEGDVVRDSSQDSMDGPGYKEVDFVIEAHWEGDAGDDIIEASVQWLVRNQYGEYGDHGYDGGGEPVVKRMPSRWGGLKIARAIIKMINDAEHEVE